MANAPHPKDILRSLDAAARKSLSQNYLLSEDWAKKLVHATLDTADGAYEEVWEIGPGLGALSRWLLEETKLPVRLFEYDRKVSQYLREQFPAADIREGDFLETDLATTLPAIGKVALLSNLPYHLSSPILFMLLEERLRFTHWIFTFQKEYAERLVAKPRTSAYGALSILIQTCFRIESLGILPAHLFFPAPNVDSAAAKFIPIPDSDVPYTALRKLVKSAFLHRRKKLIRNLEADYPKEAIAKTFQRFSLSENVRAEEISPPLYVEMARALSFA